MRNHERLCKENPNRQISPFVMYNKECTDHKRDIWNKGLNKENDERVAKQSKTLAERYEKGELISSQKGKPLTKEQKIHLSKVRKQYLKEHPDMVPYKINHHSKQSFPEKYFRDLFDTDRVLCKAISEYRVNLYSLDFAFPDIHLYIEIDGEQHYTDKRIIQHDKKRTSELEKLGWKVFRIRWSEYQKLSLEERYKIIKHIKALVAQLAEHLTSSE